MNTAEIELVKISASLLGGGAIGAIITAIITNHRNRIQPIGKDVNIETVFSPGKIFKDHLTKITFSGVDDNYHFDNLYLVRIEMINEGNKDYPEFNFGITLPDYAKAINIKSSGEDRHHTISVSQNIDFSSPTRIIDCNLTPFNRKDIYNISLFVTCTGNNVISNVDISTDMPIRFKEIQIISETTIVLLEEIIKRTSFWPFR